MKSAVERLAGFRRGELTGNGYQRQVGAWRGLGCGTDATWSPCGCLARTLCLRLVERLERIAKRSPRRLPALRMMATLDGVAIINAASRMPGAEAISRDSRISATESR